MKLNSIKSVYSKTFISDRLTKSKYEYLKSKAIRLLDIRNHISKKVHNDIMTWLYCGSKFDWIKLLYKDLQNEFNEDKLLSCAEIQDAIGEVYAKVSLRYSRLKTNTKFVISHSFEVKRTKKNVVKEFKLNRYTSDLTGTLSYMIRSQFSESLYRTLAAKEINNTNLTITNVVKYIDKFGYDRLMNLAKTKFKRIANSYKYPIRFDKLTFGSFINEWNELFNYNKNYNSDVNSFITLLKQNYKNKNSIVIPIKYAKEYHGTANQYANSYKIQILTKNRIAIIGYVDGTRPVATDGNNIIGVDINVKNNLFTLSDGYTIDFDRELILRYVKYFHYKKASLNKRNDYFMWQKRVSAMIVDRCRQLVDYIKLNGYNHIVLEDINLKHVRGNLTIAKDFDNTTHIKLMNMLGAKSIKWIVKRLAYKHNISVSICHSYLTSQECPSCGHYSKNNRPTQETFKCELCGHTDNADANAAKNIRNRVSNITLRKLLVRNEHGEFSPRSLSVSTFKELWSSLRAPR